MVLGRPNILIFMVDQLRYDACGCYGRGICQTPSLDRLASQGMRFTNAYTPAPVCSPARASFWTGLWPARHGVLMNTHWQYHITKPRLDGDVPTLGQLFQAAGYRTAHFGKWHVGPDSETSRCGFSCVVGPKQFAKPDHVEVEREVVRPYIRASYTFAGTTTAEGEQILETWLCRQAEAWLRTQVEADEPFFCCVSTPGPHPPYVVPQNYATRYTPAQMPLWPNMADDLADKPRVQRLFRDQVTHGGSLSDEEWRISIARYYAKVTLIDDQLGHMLNLLDEMGVLDNTIVVFCTDHGDLIGAHRLWDKGPMMYDEQLHVPLVIRWPGVTPAGQACDAMISSFTDLMPTLAEVAGLALQESVDGRNLMRFLRGEKAQDWPDDVYAQYDGGGLGPYSLRAVRSRRYKYVYYPYDQDELYDLEADPWELQNLAQDTAAVPILTDMKARLASWMRKAKDPLLEWNLGLTT